MGAGQKVIGTLLGHSDGPSTEHYTHICRERDDGDGRGTMVAVVWRGRCAVMGWCAWRMCGASIIPRGYGAARVRQRLACSSDSPPR
jgi:hypothetical protein